MFRKQLKNMPRSIRSSMTSSPAWRCWSTSPDPQSVVHACARLVKPGGQVFFSTINRNGKAWLMAVVGAEYVMKMVPKGTHDVKKFIKPDELLGWVDQTTLKEQHIIGLHYNPLTNTFKLAPGVDVNYMLHTTAKQD